MKIVTFPLAALLCGTMLAQVPPLEGGERRGGPRGEQLKNFLKATDEQVDELQALRRSSRELLMPILQDMREKRAALREAMQQEAPDTALVGQLTVDLKALREQIKAKRGEQREQALALLTPSQIEALDGLKQAMESGPAAHQAVRMNLLEGPDRPFGRMGQRMGRHCRWGTTGKRSTSGL